MRLGVACALLLLACGGDPGAGADEGAEAAGFSSEPVECLPLVASCREVEAARGYRCIDSHSDAEDALLERCLRSGGARSATPCDARGAECGCRMTTAFTRACRVVWTFRSGLDPARCRANCESIGGVALAPPG